jgi:hypothetical protein
VAIDALSKFRIIAQRLNEILKLLDPYVAAQYEELLNRAKKELAYFRMLSSEDPSLWHGKMILFNLLAPPHQDFRNPPAEWTPLHAAGNFTGGRSLFIHDLNLCLRYLPGDLIFIRGHALTHSVEPWIGGQRISAVYFTHESVWKYFK